MSVVSQAGATAGELYQRLQASGDAVAWTGEIMAHPELAPQLLAIIRTDRGSVKFRSAKIIQLLAERQPALLYPYFQEIADLLSSSNSFIKWGAIITLANLFPVDRENLFLSVRDRYFNLIDDASMITAGNVIAQAGKYVRLHPEQEQDLTRRLLRVTENTYWHKGQPSPECKNIVCGMVIDCFDQYFHLAGQQKEILAFAEKQLQNPRKKVAAKAEAFLRRHGTP
jgi:hypothetical protein